MRENRPYGSEGGEGTSPSLPLSIEWSRRCCLWPPLDQRLHHPLQDGLYLLRDVRAILERWRFVHVGALCQLQLHRMERAFGLAVVAGDVAAFEAAVEHLPVAEGIARFHDGVGQALGAALA